MGVPMWPMLKGRDHHRIKCGIEAPWWVAQCGTDDLGNAVVTREGVVPMRIQEFMNTAVAAVDPATSAEDVWALMQLRDIHHVVVLDPKTQEVVGVLSHRDLGGEYGTLLREGTQAKDLMRRQVVFAEPTTTVKEAANLLRGHSVGCLPIIESQTQKLVGIITITDLLDLLGQGIERVIAQVERQPVLGYSTVQRSGH